MKQFLILLLMTGACQGEKYKAPVIVTKSNVNEFKQPLAPGWCLFYYKTHARGDLRSFRDSCYKYNVGDTLHFKIELR